MTKKELEQLADKYQKKADKANRKYQDTGLRRYAREHKNNEELADAMRMAADAADNHRMLMGLRSQFGGLAKRASEIQQLPRAERPEALEKLRRSLFSAGRTWGLIQ